MSRLDMSAYGGYAGVSEKGETPPPHQVEIQTEGQPTVPSASDSASCTDHGLAPGMQLGERYELRMRIGKGGMGTVFLARDTSLASDVALKVLHRDVTGREDALRHLRSEVSLAQKIAHQNVCRTYDLEEVGDCYFIKMEYVIGETLGKLRQRQARLAIDEVLRIARAIVAGLGAAHGQGVVHCDLKPDNILIEHQTSRVVLMDFGLARVETRSRALDRSEVSGTPAYMAPEQLTGGPVGPAADLYALGCVLYELLVGTVPYPQATTFESATRCAEKPIPDPRLHRPDIPIWLSDIVQRLLAKSPKQRGRSASELLLALRGPEERPARHKTPIILGLGGATILAAVLAWFATVHPSSSWQPEIQARSPTYEENAGNAVISPDGKSLAYVSNREGIWRLYVEPLVGGTSRPLSDGYFFPVRWAHDSQALLGVTPNFRVLRIAIPGGATEELAQGASEAVDCAGRLVLATQGADQGSDGTRLMIQERPGLPPRELLRFPEHTLIKDLYCDRAGEQLAYAVITLNSADLSQSDIHVLDVEEGTAHRLTFDQKSNRKPVFAPDGKSLIFSSLRSGTSELWELPVHGGDSLLIPTGLGRVAFLNGLTRMSASDISPDGKILLLIEETPALPCFAYRLDTGERRRIGQTLDFFSNPYVTLDDRQVIVRLTRQSKTYAAALSVDTGEETILSAADAFALTPDGQEIVIVRHDGKDSQVQAKPRAGGDARPLGRFPGPVISMTLGGDGGIYAWLGTFDRPQGVWRIPLTGGPAMREELPRDTVMVPAPTGGWRLVGHRVNHLMFRWHLLPPGTPTDAPPSKTFEASYGVSWAPDGKSFVSWTGHEIVHHIVDTGVERPLLRSDVLEGKMALSHDGKTLFFAEWSGRVTRQMIVNFADRPRPGL